MPSFDIVSKVNEQEVDNAVNTTIREMTNRFDFKGTQSKIERKELEITITADDQTKLAAIQGMLKTHFTKRQIDVKALDFGKPESASGNLLRQVVKVKQGVDQDNAKKIVKTLKESGLKKVQASIRGEEVRVDGPKRDDLQAAIQVIKAIPLELPLQFINFRD